MWTYKKTVMEAITVLETRQGARHVEHGQAEIRLSPK